MFHHLSLFDDDAVEAAPDAGESDSTDCHTLDEAPVDYAPQATDLTSVEVRRSARRRKSVIAFRENGKTIVVAPTRMSQADVDAYVRELVGRLDRKMLRNSGSAALLERASRLVASYFDRDIIAGHRVPVQIKWVTNQNSRWGSCTPGDGMIRISHRLVDAPDYVIDSVLVHELAHLVVLGHGPAFQKLIAAYPHYERAEAFLAGYSLGQRAERTAE